MVFKKLRDKINQYFSKEETKEKKDIVKMIVTYGVTGYCAVWSLFNFGSLNPFNIIGYGCLIYLFMDISDYVMKRIRGKE